MKNEVDTWQLISIGTETGEECRSAIVYWKGIMEVRRIHAFR